MNSADQTIPARVAWMSEPANEFSGRRDTDNVRVIAPRRDEADSIYRGFFAPQKGRGSEHQIGRRFMHRPQTPRRTITMDNTSQRQDRPVDRHGQKHNRSNEGKAPERHFLTRWHDSFYCEARSDIRKRR
jgi:hypothetical protein